MQAESALIIDISTGGIRMSNGFDNYIPEWETASTRLQVVEGDLALDGPKRAGAAPSREIYWK
jgi:hypothetical protein